MFKYPKFNSIVVARIVALTGILALIISVFNFVYTFRKDAQRIERLKEEIVIELGIKEFVKEKAIFLVDFREFESELNILKNNNPNDANTIGQAIIDFYFERGRDYYLRNKNFLESEQLNLLYEKIERSMNSKTLNNPENFSERNEFGLDITNLLSELHDHTLEVANNLLNRNK